MTGTEVARVIIASARGNRDSVAAFHEAAAKMDEEARGADAWLAELRMELGDWLYRTDQAEFATYVGWDGMEHAAF